MKPMNDHRLLILDDDEMIGQTMAYIAQSIGLTTRTTLSAEEFFVEVEGWDPTHIALDLIMPDMDGVEVLVELARRDCQAGIIISSGVGARVLDAARRSAAEHGLNIIGVLSKPFSPSLLRELLKTPAPQKSGVPARSPSPAANVEVSREELSAAIENNELVLVFQPKVWCASGSLAGFEALVRWQSPSRGLVMPWQFIPVAESEGLIDALTGKVIEMGLEWIANDLGVEPNEEDRLTLSINLSALTLSDPEFIDQLHDKCKGLGIPTSQLIFELTETSAMEDPVASLDLLTRMRMKGFQLSIDDFGTGFSSMLQLVRLPFSEIKVDRSFVMSAMRSEESRAVIRSVVELGHSLGLKTTAEGVEDAQTLEFLKSLRCDLAQGYFIAKPLSAEDALKWARNN
jgi:EAL domain-containing protein (putative c-di-GMP-specific phosphodiesterase class I)/FixJ family two-component response regulator